MGSTGIEVQGHRGQRGHFPENTLPAFLSAIKKGVDVLELDVVISQDKKVVVSHEAFMSSLYMLTPAHKPISKKAERKYNLYEMSYEEIKKFDAGSKGNPHFPDQQKIKTYKPLLSEVFDTVEATINSPKLKPIRYNIEIKSVPEEYGVWQPYPEEMVNLVVQVIQQKKLAHKVSLQSFDRTILMILHQQFPEFPLAYLVETGTVQENLSLLSFTPQIYSPYYKLIQGKSTVKQLHKLGMKVIPWTVNNSNDINTMIALGVDGIISDYPEKVLTQLNSSS